MKSRSLEFRVCGFQGLGFGVFSVCGLLKGFLFPPKVFKVF